MGVFYHSLEIGRGPGGPFENLSALVHTGSLYTWIPRPRLERLGLHPSGTSAFQMAAGTIIERDITEAFVQLNGDSGHTIVVFGDAGDQVLLGAYTLEGFALCADPVNKRLVPMQFLPAM